MPLLSGRTKTSALSAVVPDCSTVGAKAMMKRPYLPNYARSSKRRFRFTSKTEPRYPSPPVGDYSNTILKMLQAS